MVSDSFVVRVGTKPLFPLIVSPYVPGVALRPTLTVSLEVPGVVTRFVLNWHSSYWASR
jgi:hypothetical protein